MSNKNKLLRHKITIIENTVEDTLSMASSIKYPDTGINSLSYGQKLVLAITKGVENEEIVAHLFRNLQKVMEQSVLPEEVEEETTN